MRSLYRLCLRAYPAAFRQRHGTEMLRMVESEWRAARAAGLRATLAFLVQVLSDLLRTVPHERLGALTVDGWIGLFTATICGATMTWVQFAGDDFSATVVVAVTGTIFFSYFAEVRTWRWPAIVGLWLPSSYLVAYLIGNEAGQHLSGSGPWIFLGMLGWSLAISFAGTGIGVLLRRALPLRHGCHQREKL